jgi:hypothetical protein
MQLATKRLIDSVWTVAFTVGDDGRATIHGYSRDCERGYANEGKLPRCNLIECKQGRIVCQLVVQPYASARSWADPNAADATVYEVANPQNVFSYGEIPKGEQS